MPYPWQKSSQSTFSEKNMDVDTEWIKYSRVSGRASVPRLVMLKTKLAISYIKQSLVLCQETLEQRNGHLENQGETERSITGKSAGERKRMGKADEFSLSVQAVQCCLPWTTPGCSPKDRAVGTGTPGAGVSHIRHMGCKGTPTWLRGDGETPARVSRKSKEGSYCVCD